MDEAEAEVVLLALGPQLTWEQQQTWDFAHTKERTYAIQRRDYDIIPGFSYHWYTRDTTEGSDYRYAASKQEAKAACERHNATGQWQVERFCETVFRGEQVPE